MKLALAATLLSIGLISAVHAETRTSSPDDASVSFYSPVGGTEINASFVHIIMNLNGMEIAPAGTEKPNTGHHHLLINTTIDDLELDQPIPSDENHVHFGGGQTETKLHLAPGTYTLQLVLADHNHVPHDPPIVSELIEIEMLRPTRVSPAGAFWSFDRSN